MQLAVVPLFGRFAHLDHMDFETTAVNENVNRLVAMAGDKRHLTQPCPAPGDRRVVGDIVCELEQSEQRFEKTLRLSGWQMKHERL